MKSNLLHPRVTDNDRDEITVTLNGKELRGWSYSSDQERRVKMLCAREYVEGFCALSDIAERMAEALEGMIAMLEYSMSCMRHRDTRKRFVPGVSDVEIKPDGSLNLSDARSALSAFKDAGR